MQRKLLVIISVDFDAAGQLLIIVYIVHSANAWEKKWEYNEAVHQLFTDFKKAYDSVRRAVLCNILTEFGIPMKQEKLIKMCLNETYSRVRLGKHLSDMFPVKNGCKEVDALSPVFFKFASDYVIW